MTPERMAALHAACFTTPRPWSAAEFAALEADPLVFALTLPEGFVLGRAVAGEAELLTIAVAPDQRGLGFGKKLVHDFLHAAARRGAESAFLEVAEGNAAARALYAATGFRLAGRRRGYYHGADGGTQDALVLVRALSEPI